MARGNFARGPERRGGRQKGDPNAINGYTLKKNYRPPKPASQKKTNRGGKIHCCLDVPPYLYEQMRLEALNRNISMQRLGLEWLEAAAGYFEEKKAQ